MISKLRYLCFFPIWNNIFSYISDAENNCHPCHTKCCTKASIKHSEFGINASPIVTMDPRLPHPSSHEDTMTWMSVWRVGVFLILFIYLFIYWLCWVFVAARGLSVVVVSGGCSSLPCTGFSLRWLLLLQSTGSRPVGFSSCGTQAQ